MMKNKIIQNTESKIIKMTLDFSQNLEFHANDLFSRFDTHYFLQ